MSKPSPPSPPQQQPQLPSPTTAATTTTTLPVLESIDASIFVPIQPNNLIPPSSPSNNNEDSHSTTNTARLHAILAGLGSHHAAVRSNITSLVRQECARIVLDTRAREAASIPSGNGGVATPPQQQQPPPPTRRAAPEDLDAMIANMRSGGDTFPPGPDQADRAATATTTATTSSKESRLIESVVPWPPDGTPREDCARNIMVTLDRGLVELASFDNHVAKTRLFYETALQREAARDAEQESAN
ncbi:hypothetical protein N3K66_002628 [Trichothecium roseum]|uniref:Uncharacterized protein n=1 Tax=Trichothecium roseum TaxID=47278 RepID=A0ACC0VBJ8_9HYPO|nr:hypothetical protein N3K66_002628 [Trichothecium roseum]